ncbi:hypothetical protein T09_4208 [Trichinella sp. T9]|nr:hypothetical protein T09_4208 [Trichinella sp. T9]
MKKKSKSGVDAVRNADGMMQNDKREKTEFERENKKFQCTKTGFERCAMQITIAIKGALSSI